ncbi:protein FAM221B-like [Actinia tenebrosa]|uniref:Protein FAM221B-like n=1 Tax=Actinia tenebrosa TaxID=6105 RepID=A0A6P8HHJ1_ACTTE|nr:protein FAM221B-like [Actinia tenebrosa]
MAESKRLFSSDLGEGLKDLSVSPQNISNSRKGHSGASGINVRGKVLKNVDKKTKPKLSSSKPVSVRPCSNQKTTEDKQAVKSKDRQSRIESSFTPKGYTSRPIVPATKAELLPVAHAMHGEDFAPRVKELFDPESKAALEAIETGIYIGWRCPDFKHDCIRVGRFSKCFCGHLLSEHRKYDGHSFRVPCALGQCECKAFAFVPSRAEEVGEFWLQRRVNFDPSTWRAKCKCKHTHEEHAPNGMKRCRVKGCRCSTFFSNFLCCACDKHWEEHETVFETAEMRKSQGIPYGESYLPFHELPELRNVVLTGKKDDNSLFEELASGPFAIPKDVPSPLALRLSGENQRSHEKHGRSQRF